MCDVRSSALQGRKAVVDICCHMLCDSRGTNGSKYKNTLLPTGAPYIDFRDVVDYWVELWSAGCAM